MRLFACAVFLAIGGVCLVWKGLFVQRSTIAADEAPDAAPFFTLSCQKSNAPGEPLPSLQKTCKQTLLVLIDALRHDFALDAEFSPLGAWFTQLHRQKAAFVRTFVADPPTTTSQRLEGIFAGVYPTFLDAARNFATERTPHADNVIDALWAANAHRCHFYGDETWLQLFEGVRADGVSAGFHSFDMFDLDAVDSSVYQRLKRFDASVAPDFAFLGIHLLGVDHAGHAHSAKHPALRAKLREYVEVLQAFEARQSPHTALVVFGDHGMTEGGDHGGESWPEVASALLWHSNDDSQAFGRFAEGHAAFFADLAAVRDAVAGASSPETKFGAVRQVDFANTFAVVHGLPLPRPSVGSLMPEIVLRHAWAAAASDAAAAAGENAEVDEWRIFAHVADAVRLCVRNVQRYTWPTLQHRLPPAQAAEFARLFGRFAQIDEALCADAQRGLRNVERTKKAIIEAFEVSQRITRLLQVYSISIHFGRVLWGVGLLAVAVAACSVCLRRKARFFVAAASFVAIFYISNSQIENEHRLVAYIVASIFAPSIVTLANTLTTAASAAFGRKNAVYFLLFVLLRFHQSAKPKGILGGAVACFVLHATSFLIAAFGKRERFGRKIAAKCALLIVASMLELFGAHLHCFRTLQFGLLGAAAFASNNISDFVSLLVVLLQRPLEGAMLFCFLQLAMRLAADRETGALKRHALLCVAGWTAFVLTDHTYAISSIQWDRAFFGGMRFSFWRNLLCIGLNTLGPFVLPLLLLAEDASDAALLCAVEGVKLVGCAVCCYVHARHLMAFAVFMPRFVLQVAVCAVAATGAISFALFEGVFAGRRRQLHAKIAAHGPQ